MKRPILYWVILFILGEILYKVFSISLVGLIVTGIFLVGYYVVWRLRAKNRILHLVGALFFVLGVFCMHSWERMMTVCEYKTGERVVFQGVVQKREVSGEKVSYIVKTSRINETKIVCNLQVQFCEGVQVTLGSTIIGSGDAREYNCATNPGGYDEKSYQNGKGCLLALKNVIVTEEDTPVFLWREYLNQLQMYFADIYFKLFDEKNASLATAMVLGEKSNLDSNIEALYQRNGIAHLIAISGLHIAMIGGLLYKILRKMIGSYSVSACVGVTFIIAYGVMTGLSSATLRAIIMLITSIGADVFGRRYDALTAISIALFFMLVQNPYQITQVGFLLSFGAILGIAIVNPVWKIWFPKTPKVFDGLFVSISVQLVLLPILLYFFYEIPVYGVFLNVIVVPVMNILLILLLLCAMLGGVSMEVATLVTKPADWIFSLYETLCELSEKLPGHTVCTGRPDIWWIIVYYVLLILIIWFAYRLNKKGACLTLVFWGLILCTFYLPEQLRICVYDVGQGDGIYISTPNHRYILVDGGSSSEMNVGTYVLENGLKYYGTNVLDYVFISHSDSDHYSGVKELLEEQSIKIKNVVLPAITNPDDSYRMLEDLALKKGCTLYYMKKGDVLQVDGVNFYCINPRKEEYQDKNEGSLVLQMKYEAFDMLLTGDLNQTGESEILNEIQGEIEVLKVAHHGSATSSSDIFLKKVRPAIACVSVGEYNQYGHPATEVMERLQQIAGKIYLTKESGAITIETDGKEYTVSTFLK